MASRQIGTRHKRVIALKWAGKGGPAASRCVLTQPGRREIIPLLGTARIHPERCLPSGAPRVYKTIVSNHSSVLGPQSRLPQVFIDSLLRVWTQTGDGTADSLKKKKKS